MRFAVQLIAAVVLAAVRSVFAQIPCDDEYGQFCPEASGLEVGECLKKLGPEKLSADCQKYINIHETCYDDIASNCAGKEYTGDLLVCLTEWTNAELISSDQCKANLPKKEIKEKKKQSKEDKKKADERRKIRNKAAKMARKEL